MSSRAALRLTTTEDPVTGPGEIVVRVHACGLNRVEHALRRGGIGAAGTVVAAGDHVTRFAVGDEVFGHFQAESWAAVDAPYIRTAADAAHVEHRPDGLDPLAATALAEDGLTAKTIMRAADLRPRQIALVIGATSRAGTVLVPLLAGAGAYVITGPCTSADPIADAVAPHPEVALFVDLVSFDEPYFITAAANHGTIVTALPVVDEPGIPRIAISAEPGDLAALAQHALGGRQAAEIAALPALAGGG